MQNNENLIVWEPRYAIGIPVIDSEHMKLVRLCNTLYKSILSTKSDPSLERKAAVRSALRECAEYTQTHFKNEEKLMQLCNYSGFEKHKNEHTMFIKKVLEKCQHFSEETFSSSLEFVRFLYDWILYHIAHTDTLYVRTLKEWYEKNPNYQAKQKSEAGD